MSDGRYIKSHTVTFTELTWQERIFNFGKYLPKQIPLFATVTISFWGASEVLAEIGGERLSLKTLAIPALLTAFVVAAYQAFKDYASYVPEALSSESKSAKTEYRKGRSGWQFALAKKLLSKRILELDKILGRIETGSQFIHPERMSGADYLNWLQGRPEILIRLVRATAVQCTHELPQAISRTQREGDLTELKSSVNQLALLYEETTKFEIELRSVVPPEELMRLHAMTFGWSSQIRNGVLQFLKILEQISKVKAERIISGKEIMPNFEIEFLPPDNLDEVINTLKAVSASFFR